MKNPYPALAALLKAAGCERIRHVKGDHEIWTIPLTAKPFTVERGITPRHTANGVLKQAGLPKAF